MCLGRACIWQLRFFSVALTNFQNYYSIDLSSKPLLVFTQVMRRPCCCTKQWQNVAHVLHNNRIKFPNDFFPSCSVHQHGRRDVTWKPRIRAAWYSLASQTKWTTMSSSSQGTVLYSFFSKKGLKEKALRTEETKRR